MLRSVEISRSLRQDFFLEAKAARNTVASHHSPLCRLWPINDESLTMQYLCTEMPPSKPPSRILTHILTLPPLHAFQCVRYPAGSAALTRSQAFAIWTFFLQRKPANCSAHNLITLEQSRPTFLWSLSLAERPWRFLPEAEVRRAFSLGNVNHQRLLLLFCRFEEDAVWSRRRC